MILYKSGIVLLGSFISTRYRSYDKPASINTNSSARPCLHVGTIVESFSSGLLLIPSYISISLFDGVDSIELDLETVNGNVDDCMVDDDTGDFISIIVAACSSSSFSLLCSLSNAAEIFFFGCTE
jgi:hypothetical protein